MLRVATPEDVDAILAFLLPYAATSMFLRSNLLAHGVEEKEHRHGGTFLLWEEHGALRGVLAHSNQGLMLCQCPDASPEVWRDFAAWLVGKNVAGISGDVAQVRAAVQAFGWPEEFLSLNRTEPLFELDFKDLLPRISTIRAPHETDFELLARWFAAYAVDAGIEPDIAIARGNAEVRAKRAINECNIRLLVEDGELISMAGINAQADQMVQIGGVYTPPERRGEGFAGQVVAAFLNELRHEGIQQAILFAASSKAARAYEKIGFRQIGEYQLCLLKTPHIQGRP
ncbi:MAG: GNAT family N-acetyltransferase [Cognatishimia sp.]|uniref:GNAT family N-acetyltransferase n=1 Tax=Cognatishimia sp. TaxID=2211648 RepID=UPI003B8BCD11